MGTDIYTAWAATDPIYTFMIILCETFLLDWHVKYPYWSDPGLVVEFLRSHQETASRLLHLPRYG
jgi:hypothetical protein